jgi:hypothetical protein
VVEDAGPLGQLAREPNSTHYQRSETAAALIRKLILEDRMTDPMAIARVVVEKMKARQVRPTKNLFMVCTMIKDYLLKLHFKPLDPSLHTWRHVARQLKQILRANLRYRTVEDGGARRPLAEFPRNLRCEFCFG